MGKTICDLVLDNPDMDLVGMVERPEYQPRVAPVVTAWCPMTSSPLWTHARRIWLS